MIHLPVIRALTRQLPVVYPEVADETRSAFVAQFEKHGKLEKDGTFLPCSRFPLLVPHPLTSLVLGWTSVKAFNAFMGIVTQLNARTFIGLPLCRDEKWKKSIEKGGADMTWRALLLRMFPEQRRAWVYLIFHEPWLTDECNRDANEYIKRFSHVLEDCITLLTPVLEQRRAMREDERPVRPIRSPQAQY